MSWSYCFVYCLDEDEEDAHTVIVNDDSEQGARTRAMVEVCELIQDGYFDRGDHRPAISDLELQHIGPPIHQRIRRKR